MSLYDRIDLTIGNIYLRSFWHWSQEYVSLLCTVYWWSCKFLVVFKEAVHSDSLHFIYFSMWTSWCLTRLLHLGVWCKKEPGETCETKKFVWLIHNCGVYFICMFFQTFFRNKCSKHLLHVNFPFKWTFLCRVKLFFWVKHCSQIKELIIRREAINYWK